MEDVCTSVDLRSLRVWIQPVGKPGNPVSRYLGRWPLKRALPKCEMKDASLCVG